MSAPIANLPEGLPLHIFGFFTSESPGLNTYASYQEILDTALVCKAWNQNRDLQYARHMALMEINQKIKKNKLNQQIRIEALYPMPYRNAFAKCKMIISELPVLEIAQKNMDYVSFVNPEDMPNPVMRATHLGRPVFLLNLQGEFEYQSKALDRLMPNAVPGAYYTETINKVLIVHARHVEQNSRWVHVWTKNDMTLEMILNQWHNSIKGEHLIGCPTCPFSIYTSDVNPHLIETLLRDECPKVRIAGGYVPPQPPPPVTITVVGEATPPSTSASSARPTEAAPDRKTS